MADTTIAIGSCVVGIIIFILSVWLFMNVKGTR